MKVKLLYLGIPSAAICNLLSLFIFMMHELSLLTTRIEVNGDSRCRSLFCYLSAPISWFQRQSEIPQLSSFDYSLFSVKWKKVSFCHKWLSQYTLPCRVLREEEIVPSVNRYVCIGDIPWTVHHWLPQAFF